MTTTTDNIIEATYRTSLWTWNEFQIYSILLETTESYLYELHDCGNLYSPCFEELGELLERECYALWGGLNPEGDRLSDVDWNEIAEEWYDSVIEAVSDSLEETR